MPDLYVPFIGANIGKSPDAVMVAKNIRRVRTAFPHKNPLVTWQEIDEGHTGVNEHAMLEKVFGAGFQHEAFKSKEPITVPKESFVVDSTKSKLVMKGVPKKSPTRYVHTTLLHPKNAMEKTFAVVNTHFPNFEPDDPRWKQCLEGLQEAVALCVNLGHSTVWQGDTNANFPKNMPKVHPKERRVIAKGNDYLGIINVHAPHAVRIGVAGTGTIDLTIDGHNAHWAMLRFG